MIEEDKQGFRIYKLHEIGANASGETYEVLNSGGEGMLVAYRKAGSLSGNHYHKGQVEVKNPEQLLLLQGEVDVVATHLESDISVESKATSPCRVEFYPNWIHTIKARTDVLFIELNSLAEHKKDTYYP